MTLKKTHHPPKNPKIKLKAKKIPLFDLIQVKNELWGVIHQKIQNNMKYIKRCKANSVPAKEYLRNISFPRKNMCFLKVGLSFDYSFKSSRLVVMTGKLYFCSTQKSSRKWVWRFEHHKNYRQSKLLFDTHQKHAEKYVRLIPKSQHETEKILRWKSLLVTGTLSQQVWRPHIFWSCKEERERYIQPAYLQILSSWSH